MVRGKRHDLPARPLDTDLRAHLEGVPLDASLELLIAVVREPSGTAGKEHRRQRAVERERRVIAAAEAAADIGELSVDHGRLERVVRLAQEKGDRGRGFKGDCTPSTSSRLLRPASYQARPHSGSRNIGSTDWVSNSRSSTSRAGSARASSARISSP